MSDFLTRLAERALGLGPMIRPWVAPRFAEDTRPFGLEAEGPPLPLPKRLRSTEAEEMAERAAERRAEPRAETPTAPGEALPLPARLRSDRATEGETRQRPSEELENTPDDNPIPPSSAVREPSPPVIPSESEESGDRVAEIPSGRRDSRPTAHPDPSLSLGMTAKEAVSVPKAEPPPQEHLPAGAPPQPTSIGSDVVGAELASAHGSLDPRAEASSAPTTGQKVSASSEVGAADAGPGRTTPPSPPTSEPQPTNSAASESARKAQRGEEALDRPGEKQLSQTAKQPPVEPPTIEKRSATSAARLEPSDQHPPVDVDVSRGEAGREPFSSPGHSTPLAEAERMPHATPTEGEAVASSAPVPPSSPERPIQRTMDSSTGTPPVATDLSSQPPVASVRGEETGTAPPISPPVPTVIPSGSEESGGRVAGIPPVQRDSRPPAHPDPSLSLGMTEQESESAPKAKPASQEALSVSAPPRPAPSSPAAEPEAKGLVSSDHARKTQRGEESGEWLGVARPPQAAKPPVEPPTIEERPVASAARPEPSDENPPADIGPPRGEAGKETFPLPGHSTPPAEAERMPLAAPTEGETATGSAPPSRASAERPIQRTMEPSTGAPPVALDLPSPPPVASVRGEEPGTTLPASPPVPAVLPSGSEESGGRVAEIPGLGDPRPSARPDPSLSLGMTEEEEEEEVSAIDVGAELASAHDGLDSRVETSSAPTSGQVLGPPIPPSPPTVEPEAKGLASSDDAQKAQRGKEARERPGEARLPRAAKPSVEPPTIEERSAASEAPSRPSAERPIQRALEPSAATPPADRPSPPPPLASVRGEEAVTPPSPTVIPSGSEESGGRVTELASRQGDSRPPTRPDPSLSLGMTEQDLATSDAAEKARRGEEARERPGEVRLSQTAKPPVESPTIVETPTASAARIEPSDERPPVDFAPSRAEFSLLGDSTPLSEAKGIPQATSLEGEALTDSTAPLRPSAEHPIQRAAEPSTETLSSFTDPPSPPPVTSVRAGERGPTPSTSPPLPTVLPSGSEESGDRAVEIPSQGDSRPPARPDPSLSLGRTEEEAISPPKIGEPAEGSGETARRVQTSRESLSATAPTEQTSASTGTPVGAELVSARGSRPSRAEASSAPTRDRTLSTSSDPAEKAQRGEEAHDRSGEAHLPQTAESLVESPTIETRQAASAIHRGPSDENSTVELGPSRREAGREPFPLPGDSTPRTEAERIPHATPTEGESVVGSAAPPHPSAERPIQRTKTLSAETPTSVTERPSPPPVASVRREEMRTAPPSSTVIPSGSEESRVRVAEIPSRPGAARPPVRPDPSLSLGKTEKESGSVPRTAKAPLEGAAIERREVDRAPLGSSPSATPAPRAISTPSPPNRTPIQRSAAEASAAPSAPVSSVPVSSVPVGSVPVGSVPVTAVPAGPIGATPSEAPPFVPAIRSAEAAPASLLESAVTEDSAPSPSARRPQDLASSDVERTESEESRPLRRPTSIDEAPTEKLEREPARRKGFDLERGAVSEGGEERSARQATVRISIGRVEVRVEEKAKPIKPSPRRPSVPSLADYLAGRRGQR